MRLLLLKLLFCNIVYNFVLCNRGEIGVTLINLNYITVHTLHTLRLLI